MEINHGFEGKFTRREILGYCSAAGTYLFGNVALGLGVYDSRNHESMLPNLVPYPETMLELNSSPSKAMSHPVLVSKRHLAYGFEALLDRVSIGELNGAEGSPTRRPEEIPGPKSQRRVALRVHAPSRGDQVGYRHSLRRGRNELGDGVHSHVPGDAAHDGLGFPRLGLRGSSASIGGERHRRTQGELQAG